MFGLESLLSAALPTLLGFVGSALGMGKKKPKSPGAPPTQDSAAVRKSREDERRRMASAYDQGDTRIVGNAAIEPGAVRRRALLGMG